jgi:hypothetical protein
MTVGAVDRLEAVTLEELVAVAALQTRTDRKYVMERDHLDRLVASVAPTAKALEIDGQRVFRYETVYFDTPGLTCYLATARRRPERFKVRTRTYVDSGACAVEVKRRDRRGQTVKHRNRYDAARRFELSDQACALVEEIPLARPFAPALRPTLVSRFQRSTLLIGGAARATIDVEVIWTGTDRGVATLGERVIVETKSAGGPCALDRALWSMHVRPGPISKYGVGMAAIDRALPANRWHRTMQRYVRDDAR